MASGSPRCGKALLRPPHPGHRSHPPGERILTMRSFPFGAAALCILALAILSGVGLAFAPAQQAPATLRLWVFAKTHYETYIKAIPNFEAQNPGVTVDLQLVSNNSLATRLQSAFLAD